LPRWTALRILPPALLAVGIALIALALEQGGAHLLLFLIFPVISGSSPEFVAGVIALVVGVFALPLSWSLARDERSTVAASPPAEAPKAVREGGGGLLLLGPVPIFFGGWKTRPPVPYWAAALLGVLLLVVVLLLFLV
jgi:uncharacterized membrane protein